MRKRKRKERRGEERRGECDLIHPSETCRLSVAERERVTRLHSLFSYHYYVSLNTTSTNTTTATPPVRPPDSPNSRPRSIHSSHSPHSAFFLFVGLPRGHSFILSLSLIPSSRLLSLPLSLSLFLPSSLPFRHSPICFLLSYTFIPIPW